MPANSRKRPSRVRYERSHPTVSCRVSREIYDRLADIKRQEGRSFADILKVGLGIIKDYNEIEESVFNDGYDLGYNAGYEAAALKFKVVFSCRRCGKPVAVEGEEDKRVVSKILEEQGMGHGECAIQTQSGEVR